ncbi:MAG: hypothetical protein SGJ20_22625 [Planctomycetota bacterium]|nr:hypothetical protein [Planctomycetota bacterium]
MKWQLVPFCILLTLIYLMRCEQLYGAEESAAASQDPRLTNALQAWTKRQQQFKTAKFRIEGSVYVPKLSRTHPRTVGRFPAEDHHSPVKIELILDFANHRWRHSSQYSTYHLTHHRYIERYLIVLFDGKECQEYRPQKENRAIDPDYPKTQPELVMDSTSPHASAIQPETVPLFIGLGFVPVNITPQSLEPVKLDPSHFEIIEKPTSSKSIFVVRVKLPDSRPGKFSEVWVDENKDFSVVRVVEYNNGSASWQADVDLEKRDSSWIPKGWQTRSLYDDNQLDRESKLKVTDVRFNEEYPATLFTKQPEPGMIIRRADKRFIVGRAGEKDIPVDGNPAFEKQ